MKIFNLNDFVSEKKLIKPLTIKQVKNVGSNSYGITKYDLIGKLEDFPLGVVVRMMEEQEKQGNTPDVTVFQKDATSSKSMKGFDWADTEDKINFWESVIKYQQFDLFFEKYPEYEIYD